MIYTSDLCDRIKDQPDGDVRVLPMIFKSYGARHAFSGHVVTVQCLDDNSWVKRCVEQPGEGRVLVIDGAASMRKALLGGNLGHAAASNGWAGVVVYGCVRDSHELATADVGILALGSIPLPTDRREQGLHQVPVQIQGVWIRPNDWLAADADGLVVASAPLTFQ